MAQGFARAVQMRRCLRCAFSIDVMGDMNLIAVRIDVVDYGESTTPRFRARFVTNFFSRWRRGGIGEPGATSLMARGQAVRGGEITLDLDARPGKRILDRDEFLSDLPKLIIKVFSGVTPEADNLFLRLSRDLESLVLLAQHLVLLAQHPV